MGNACNFAADDEEMHFENAAVSHIKKKQT